MLSDVQKYSQKLFLPQNNLLSMYESAGKNEKKGEMETLQRCVCIFQEVPKKQYLYAV